MTKQDSAQTKSAAHSLNECVEKALENYFRDLDGEKAINLHELVISQVEKPLFQIVLDHHNGNISRTAQALGLNRGTVLGRLKKYGLAG